MDKVELGRASDKKPVTLIRVPTQSWQMCFDSSNHHWFNYNLCLCGRPSDAVGKSRGLDHIVHALSVHTSNYNTA